MPLQTPREVNRCIPPTLEAICRTAMAPLPGQRYESAQMFAADLSNWLSDQPISAHPDRLGTVWRFVRVRQALFTALGVMAICGIVGLSGVLSLLSRENRELAAANRIIEEQRDELFTAVDGFYTKSAEWLLQLPGTNDVRRDLLAQAKHHFDNIVQTSPPDKRGRVFQANASYRLAQIAHQLEDQELCAAVGHEALSRFKQLAYDYPDDHRLRFDVFHCKFLLGNYEDAFDEIARLLRTTRRAGLPGRLFSGSFRAFSPIDAVGSGGFQTFCCDGS